MTAKVLSAIWGAPRVDIMEKAMICMPSDAQCSQITQVTTRRHRHAVTQQCLLYVHQNTYTQSPRTPHRHSLTHSHTLTRSLSLSLQCNHFCTLTSLLPVCHSDSASACWSIIGKKERRIGLGSVQSKKILQPRTIHTMSPSSLSYQNTNCACMCGRMCG